MPVNQTVLLDHGAGGQLSQALIRDVFLQAFGTAEQMTTDAALLENPGGTLAFTTDSYVVKPLIFSGADIGKLAVSGTINDLAVSGARPLYLSCSVIIEEGFSIAALQTIVASMAETAEMAGVRIVTGDTKVVEHGACDGLFITTAGVGIVPDNRTHIAAAKTCRPGDLILINGPVGDHGIAVLGKRQALSFESDIVSDCAPLNHLIEAALNVAEDGVTFMRDATRGGLATVLCELATAKGLGIELEESDVPVREPVESICDLLGFDPLYLANEGKVVMVVRESVATRVLDALQMNPLGTEARIIGRITDQHPGTVVLTTCVGGTRVLDLLVSDQLPRIC